MMKNSKIILGCLISIIFATAASAAWESLTDRVTLSSLQVQGGSLIFGDKEVSEFDLFGFGDGGALDPNPDKMFVQGGKNSITGDYGLKFNLSWSAISNQTVNATLNFKISVRPGYDGYIKDVRMDLTGAGATGNGTVNATENVQNAGGDVIASLSCSKQYGDGGVYLVDHAEFAHAAYAKEIWICSKDISVTCGTGPGSAHLSEFYQYYSQTPEPATLVLLGTAGIWIFTRKKQKSLGAYKSK
jgi:hypothetical protein